MSKKFIQNLQKLIEEKDPKKDLGLVSEGNISHFQAKPPALVSDPTPVSDPFEGLPGAGGPPTPKNQNFIWNKESFNHNRGAFKDLIFEDFITTIKKSRNTITSINGDLSDYIVGDNKNVKYTVQVNVSAPITVTITPFVNNSISLAVYTAPGFSSASKVFTSGSEKYVPSNINLNLNQIGLWTITILLYQEKGNTAFNILDQLGSFVEAASESISINDQKLITFDTTQGNNGIESIFVDGAFGPSLSNVIYWNKLNNFTEDFGGGELAGYGLYTVVNERLSFDVVSGWGTDAFAVTGSQLPFFPIAGTIGIPGSASTTYKISGADFDSGANRTIVTVSGTAFSGANSDPIYVERTLHLTDILQDDTLGSVVSGTHFNVKAGDQYTYEVDTFNSFGNRGPRSTRISAIAGDINPPGLVTSLAGTGSLKAIRLTWTNPTNIDLKGIHIWDVDTIVSGTTKPIKTIIKGSNTTIPECTVINEVSSGTLIDSWPYKLYSSTFDHAGNESTEAMPTVTVTTDVEIKTSREGQRIEMDTSSNQLRFFDSNDIELLRIGENIAGSTDGLLVQSGSTIFADIFVDDNQSNPHDPILCNYEIRGNQNIFDGPGTQHRGAVAGHVFNRFVVNNSLGHNVRFAGVYGRVGTRGGGTPGTRVDLIGVHGHTDSAITGDNVYAGYFTGEKVFIEKDLIISGSGGIKSASGFQDLDGDTRIQVEESTDEDIIRFDTAGTERMLINNSGNVGIGTTAPSEILEIETAGGNSLQYAARLTNPENTDTGDTATGILFSTESSADFGKGALVYERKASFARGDFHFLQNNIGDSTSPALSDSVLTITNPGNIGIGTTTPGNTLSVAGIISGSSHLNIEGDIDHDGSNVGFYGTAPVAQQTGVAVTAAGIHAALVNLGLITA